MKVSLDSTPLGVRGLDDPGPRGPDLLQLRTELGLESLVVDRERSGGPDRLDQFGLLVQMAVVHERAKPFLSPLQDRQREPRRKVGELDLVALQVDERLPVGPPVGELDARIAE